MLGWMFRYLFLIFWSGDLQEYEEDFEELDESEGEEEEEEEEEEKEEVVVETPRQKMGAERRKEVEAIQKAMDEENRRAGGRRRGTQEEEIRPQGLLLCHSSVSQVSRCHRGGADSALSPEPEQTHQGPPHRGSLRGPQRGNFIDFVAAKQREINQKVASKQK